MKRNIVLYFLLILPLFINAQNKSVNFEEGNWESILTKAKKSDKLIFIDFYAAWCGPCKIMDNEVFTLDRVADYFNLNFINYKLDIDEGEGLELKKTYGVTAVPTYLIINKEGEVIHKLMGSEKPDIFIDKIKAGIGEENLLTMRKRFEDGERDPLFIKKFFTKFGEANMGEFLQESINKYFSEIPKEELIEEDNWAIVSKYLTDIYSPAFKYLYDNRGRFTAKYGVKAVEDKIHYTLMDKVHFYAVNGDVLEEGFENSFNEFSNYLRLFKTDRLPSMLWYLRSYEHLRNKQYQELIKDVEDLRKYSLDNSRVFNLGVVLNAFSSKIANEAPDSYYPIALSWIEELIRSNQNSPSVLRIYTATKLLLAEKMDDKALIEKASFENHQAIMAYNEYIDSFKNLK